MAESKANIDVTPLIAGFKSLGKATQEAYETICQGIGLSLFSMHEEARLWQEINKRKSEDECAGE